ncbi:hypothetical protein E4T38_03954 [Aureobasidium subglaciale]|nr:hypothetical protein E4T38_03954 [Aureobasidium subglaciale]KAI5225080.1 hypothetical protein E4T40_03729 [Aureobasidium subglaciale]KAI5228775.1 hypothetical protein E4T41_03794 [Aureobasidium subglaciale]KAI5263645.1 hypothetical protein E4T46_03570 [Aureobasidium subglaciale]
MSAPHPYPHFKDFYASKSRSDVTLCFGDEKLCAHKLVLAGASEVFHTAFKSNFAHIYGLEYDENACDLHRTEDQQLEFWVDTLLIANEYQVLSLTDAINEVILDFLEANMCPMEGEWDKDSEGRFKRTVKRLAELHQSVKLSDMSCLDGTVDVLCQSPFYSLKGVCEVLEHLEPICAKWVSRLMQANRDRV